LVKLSVFIFFFLFLLLRKLFSAGLVCEAVSKYSSVRINIFYCSAGLGGWFIKRHCNKWWYLSWNVR